MRVRLDEADFRRLVAGEVVQHAIEQPVGNDTVKVTTVELLLADIGFDRMEAAIAAARAQSRR